MILHQGKRWITTRQLGCKAGITLVLALCYITVFIVNALFNLELSQHDVGAFYHTQGQVFVGMIILLLISMRLVRRLLMRDIDVLRYKTDLIHCLGGPIEGIVNQYFMVYAGLSIFAFMGSAVLVKVIGAFELSVFNLSINWLSGLVVFTLSLLNGWHAFISLHRDRPGLLASPGQQDLYVKQAHQKNLGSDILSGSAAALLFLLYIMNINLYYLLVALLIIFISKLTQLISVCLLRIFFGASMYMSKWWVSYYRSFLNDNGIDAWVKDLTDFVVLLLSLLILFDQSVYMVLGQLWVFGVTLCVALMTVIYGLKMKINAELGNGSVLFLLGVSMSKVKSIIKWQIMFTVVFCFASALGLVCLVDRSQMIPFHVQHQALAGDVLIDLLALLVLVFCTNIFINFMVKPRSALVVE